MLIIIIILIYLNLNKLLSIVVEIFYKPQEIIPSKFQLISFTLIIKSLNYNSNFNFPTSSKIQKVIPSFDYVLSINLKFLL